MVRLNLIIILLISFSYCISQTEEERLFFRNSIDSIRLINSKIDSIISGFEVDAFPSEKYFDHDTIYYRDFTNETKLGDLVKLDGTRTIVEVGEEWLDSMGIYLFGLKKYDTKYDSMNLLLVFYDKGYSGPCWIDYNFGRSPNQIRQSVLKKINGRKFPQLYSVGNSKTRIVIDNILYYLQYTITYRSDIDKLDPFSYESEEFRCAVTANRWFNKKTYHLNYKGVTMIIKCRKNKVLYYLFRDENGYKDNPKYRPSEDYKWLGSM